MAIGQYDPIFQAAGQEWNVDPTLLKAMAAQESSGNPRAVSKANAQGLMQIIPETQKYLGVTDPNDPVQSIFAGAKYMNEALTTEKTPEDALRYYHGGPNWRDAYGPESQAYAPAVTARYQALVPPRQSPTAPVTGPVPVATSTAPTDSDEAAGLALIKSMATGRGKATTAPTDPDEAAGMALVHALPQVAAQAPVDFKPETDETRRIGNLMTPGAPTSTAPSAPPSGVNIPGFSAPPPGLDVGQIGRAAQEGYEGGKMVTPAGVALADRFGLGSVPRGINLLSGAMGGLYGGGRDLVGQAVDAVLPGAGRDATQGMELAAPFVGLGPRLPMAPVNLLTARAVGSDAALLRTLPPRFVGEYGGELTPADTVAAPLSPSFRDNPGVTAPGMTGQTTPNRLALPKMGETAFPELNPAAPSQSGLSPADAAMTAAIPEKLPRSPMIPIMSKAQAEAQADKIIQHFAGEGPTTGSMTPAVEGTNRTLADITGNPGLATLQRGFQGVNPEAFQMLKDANAEVRGKVLTKAIGQPEDVTAGEAAVNAQTGPMRDAVFANKTPADPTPTVAAIDEILKSPKGQDDAVVKALTEVRTKLTTDRTTGEQTPQTDAEQLYGIDKAIGKSISPLARGTSGDNALATRELMQVRSVLRDGIEAAAPGFKNYMATHAEGMRSVEGMRYLQSKNLTDAYGNTTLSKLDNAIKGIDTQRKLPGARPSDSISDEQYNTLTALRDSMREEGKTQTSGKFLSPGTFQDFATNSRVGGLASHPLVTMGAGAAGFAAAGPWGTAATIGAKMLLDKQQRNAQTMVNTAIQNRLMNVDNSGINALSQKNRLPP